MNDKCLENCWRNELSEMFQFCLAICVIIILLLGSSRVGSVRLSSYPVLWSSWGNLIQNNNNSNNDNNNDKSVILIIYHTFIIIIIIITIIVILNIVTLNMCIFRYNTFIRYLKILCTVFLKIK